MNKSKNLFRIVSSGLAGLAVVLFFTGADDAKQSLDARGLKFDAPASWKTVPSKSAMRAIVLKVEPTDGDDYPAELVVFVFPGGVGGVQANLERWRKQFTDKDGNPPTIESKKVKGKNVDVIRAETAGHYHPAKFPGMPTEPDRPDARLLVGFVSTDKVSYSIKMVGPDKTMIKIRPEFDALLASLKVDE